MMCDCFYYGCMLLILYQGVNRLLSFKLGLKEEKVHFFETFSSKCLEGKEILYTFALALQNKPPGKLVKA